MKKKFIVFALIGAISIPTKLTPSLEQVFEDVRSKADTLTKSLDTKMKTIKDSELAGLDIDLPAFEQHLEQHLEQIKTSASKVSDFKRDVMLAGREPAPAWAKYIMLSAFEDIIDIMIVILMSRVTVDEFGNVAGSGPRADATSYMVNELKKINITKNSPTYKIHENALLTAHYKQIDALFNLASSDIQKKHGAKAIISKIKKVASEKKGIYEIISEMTKKMAEHSDTLKKAVDRSLAKPQKLTKQKQKTLEKIIRKVQDGYKHLNTSISNSKKFAIKEAHLYRMGGAGPDGDLSVFNRHLVKHREQIKAITNKFLELEGSKGRESSLVEYIMLFELQVMMTVIKTILGKRATADELGKITEIGLRGNALRYMVGILKEFNITTNSPEYTIYRNTFLKEHYKQVDAFLNLESSDIKERKIAKLIISKIKKALSKKKGIYEIISEITDRIKEYPETVKSVIDKSLAKAKKLVVEASYFRVKKGRGLLADKAGIVPKILEKVPVEDPSRKRKRGQIVYPLTEENAVKELHTERQELIDFIFKRIKAINSIENARRDRAEHFWKLVKVPPLELNRIAKEFKATMERGGYRVSKYKPGKPIRNKKFESWRRRAVNRGRRAENRRYRGKPVRYGKFMEKSSPKLLNIAANIQNTFNEAIRKFLNSALPVAINEEAKQAIRDGLEELEQLIKKDKAEGIHIEIKPGAAALEEEEEEEEEEAEEAEEPEEKPTPEEEEKEAAPETEAAPEEEVKEEVVVEQAAPEEVTEEPAPEEEAAPEEEVVVEQAAPEEVTEEPAPEEEEAAPVEVEEEVVVEQAAPEEVTEEPAPEEEAAPEEVEEEVVVEQAAPEEVTEEPAPEEEEAAPVEVEEVEPEEEVKEPDVEPEEEVKEPDVEPEEEVKEPDVEPEVVEDPGVAVEAKVEEKEEVKEEMQEAEPPTAKTVES